MNVHWETSLSADGPMGRTVEMSDAHRMNREGFVRAHFGVTNRPVMVESVHGNRVEVVYGGNAGAIMPGCDGLLTSDARLPLMITHQDCVPIVLADHAGRFVGVVHAGWRGVVAGIFSESLKKAMETFDVHADCLEIFIGPHLRPCHFEIQEDVAVLLRAITPDAVVVREGKMYGDLLVALRAQATALQIPDFTIDWSDDCTFCSPGYASWRRDGVLENNMVTVAMIS